MGLARTVFSAIGPSSLCNNIQRDDNCWLQAHGLALIFKTGHGGGGEPPPRITLGSVTDPEIWEEGRACQRAEPKDNYASNRAAV